LQHVTAMDKAHRTAFDDMLEQAKTHSLATFKAKYQKGLEHICKIETITYRKSLSSTTNNYRKCLDASFDKHLTAMNQKSKDKDALANDLVENAPFKADKEISCVVVNDVIREVTESITNIKEQSIADWTSHTISAKSLTPHITQAVDHAMTQRKHEVIRLDEHILRHQETTKKREETITQHETQTTAFLQNSQHTFETMIKDIIKRETGNNKGPTLNDLLTRETTSAVEQMVNIREDLKTTIDTHFLAKEKEMTECMNELKSVHQLGGHGNRNHTPNDVHNDRPNCDENNPRYNPRKYSRPVQSEQKASNKMRLDKEEQLPLPWNHTAHTMRTSIQVMANIHRFKREVIQHNLTEDPRQDQLENFYNTLVTSLESYEMPIMRLTNLQRRGTTLPSEPTINALTLKTVTQVLFGKLLEAIPEECTSL
jgi:hypothetical protein